MADLAQEPARVPPPYLQIACSGSLLSCIVLRKAAGDMPVADVVRLSGIPLGGRLNAVDVQAVQNSVESTGRLAFVSVDKKLPNTLVLTVRQRSSRPSSPIA